MLLQDMFNQQLAGSSEVLTNQQEQYVFNMACDLFFSVVSIKYRVNRDVFEQVNPVSGMILSNDELGVGLNGGYEIERAVDVYGSNTCFVTVKPLDYSVATLPTVYRSDFRACCSYFINTVSQENIALLRGSGVESVDMQNVQIDEIRQVLERRYGSEYGGVLL